MSIDGVLLARHGETDDNAARRFQGHRDPPLDELGRAQALALGEELAGAGWVGSNPVVANGSVHRL